MDIKVSVKQLGKKRPTIDQKVLTIENLTQPILLEDLIKAVVKQQVESYNNKEAEKNILPFLTKSDIKEKEVDGKVGFGSIYNENKADLEKAIETALLAFTDGMYCIFLNDDQVENLKDKIELNEDTIVTFVRLTFLAGSIW